MRLISPFTIVLFAASALACSSSAEPVPSVESASTTDVATWEPVDESFAGCHGACGAHSEGLTAGAVVQPGASVGDTTYCPVSGAVFRIDETHPHAPLGDRSLYFCCAGCATYFEEHRAEVLSARGIEPS